MAARRGDSPEETNARFDELIADQFGEGWIPTLDDEPVSFDPHEPQAAVPAPPRPSFEFDEPDEPIELPAALAEDDGDFELPPQEPMQPPRSGTILIWLALGYAVTVGVVMACGVVVTQLVGWTALLAFVGGLVAAFVRLPRDRGSDDGAVV